jgi:GNAT superfamily N-acetyltransferase
VGIELAQQKEEHEFGRQWLGPRRRFSMYEVRQHNFLPHVLRKKIDTLIHDVWSKEARESRDVELFISRGDGVMDELDLLSTHVLLLNKNAQLLAYGRITLLNFKNLPEELLFKKDLSLTGTTAYISRLVVHPSHQGLGISKLIHDARLKIACAWEADYVFGWAVGETPANNLKSLGFRTLEKKQGFRCAWYQTSRNAVLMGLALDHMRMQTLERSPKVAN